MFKLLKRLFCAPAASPSASLRATINAERAAGKDFDTITLAPEVYDAVLEDMDKTNRLFIPVAGCGNGRGFRFDGISVLRYEKPSMFIREELAKEKHGEP